MPNVTRPMTLQAMSRRRIGMLSLPLTLIAPAAGGQPAPKPRGDSPVSPLILGALPLVPLPGDHARVANGAAPMPQATQTAFVPPTASDVVMIAVREYRLHGVAPVVTAGAVTIYPFGHGDAVLTCAVLRACIVELEPGEVVVDEPIAGDQARWIITSAKAGVAGRIALVVVKPKACDITTNLIIPTDRRIYDLTLDAPACPARATNPKPSYVRHIRFYFPDDSLTRLPNTITNEASARRNGSATAHADTMSASPKLPRPDSLNRAYRIQRDRRFLFWHKAPDFPWLPDDTWDDGAHVYISVPPAASKYPAAVLYAIEDDGSRALMNYAIQARGDATQLVTDRVFHRAVLVIVSGSVEHTLELVNEGWDPAVVLRPRAMVSAFSSPETKP